jgi:hypothetical protein
MSLDNSQSSVSSVQSAGTKQPMGFGVVYSVILDETHPYLKNVGEQQIEKQGEAAYMGAIQYRITGQPSTDDASLPVAFPYDKNLFMSIYYGKRYYLLL